MAPAGVFSAAERLMMSWMQSLIPDNGDQQTGVCVLVLFLRNGSDDRTGPMTQPPLEIRLCVHVLIHTCSRVSEGPGSGGFRTWMDFFFMKMCQRNLKGFL